MNLTNQIISIYEQLETETGQAGKAIATYYHSLCKERLPAELATLLTIEFARQWWTSQLGLNEQHVYMHNDGDFVEGEE